MKFVAFCPHCGTDNHIKIFCFECGKLECDHGTDNIKLYSGTERCWYCDMTFEWKYENET